MMVLSVKAVITTLDNLPNLRDSIDVLRDEPLDEIIVVNNGSVDGTKSWLKIQEDIVTINCENKGAGPGRNAGLDKAGKCDYLLMLDGGIRPLRGGTQHMLDYLERCNEADMIGVEIPDFETDYKRAWRRWPHPITNTYRNFRLSHTAYCLARFRAFDGFRFCEEGPFGEPGWGVDDDEMCYQWNEAGIVIHVVTGIHPYRHASGSFRRLYQETGIWPNQYGSVYEKRLVWCQHNWPQYQPGNQWGEPWLTVVIKAVDIERTAEMIKRAHNELQKRTFSEGWEHVPNPYSIIVWGEDEEIIRWARPRYLRQHYGNTMIIDGEVVHRDEENEKIWAGDFRLWDKPDWQSSIRPQAHYYGLVSNPEELDALIDQYNRLHPNGTNWMDKPKVTKWQIIM